MGDLIGALFSLIFMAFMFLFPVLIVVLVLVVAMAGNKRHTAAWGSFAAKMGLAIVPGTWLKAPTVSGVYKGFNTYLYTYSTGSGKSKTTYTAMAVYLPIQNVSHLRISREGFLSKITKAFGAQDIHVGDPAFDGAYIVKSDTPHLVPEILTPWARGALIQGGDSMNVTVSKGTVTWSEVGVQMNPDMLRYVLETLQMVAQRVVEVETPQQVQPQAPPAPQPMVNMPPLGACQNCGATLTWNADRTSGVAKCEYCGNEMHFRFGAVPLRRR